MAQATGALDAAGAEPVPPCGGTLGVALLDPPVVSLLRFALVPSTLPPQPAANNAAIPINPSQAGARLQPRMAPSTRWTPFDIRFSAKADSRPLRRRVAQIQPSSIPC